MSKLYRYKKMGFSILIHKGRVANYSSGNKELHEFIKVYPYERIDKFERPYLSWDEVVELDPKAFFSIPDSLATKRDKYHRVIRRLWRTEW